MTTTRQPRGIRNNNPGNIRENQRVDYDWEGEASGDYDSEFEEFESPEYGIRAMVRIFKSYRNRGIDTVAGIISTWAPPSENNTGDYIDAVASKLGVEAHTPISESYYPGLVAAIIHHENGQQPYDMATIEQGIALA